MASHLGFLDLEHIRFPESAHTKHDGTQSLAASSTTRNGGGKNSRYRVMAKRTHSGRFSHLQFADDSQISISKLATHNGWMPPKTTTESPYLA